MKLCTPHPLKVNTCWLISCPCYLDLTSSSTANYIYLYIGHSFVGTQMWPSPGPSPSKCGQGCSREVNGRTVNATQPQLATGEDSGVRGMDVTS